LSLGSATTPSSCSTPLRPTCKAPGELLDRDAARNPWTWRCGAYEASVERDSRATPFGLTHNRMTINLVISSIWSIALRRTRRPAAAA
jgi:hypothetical protein